MWLVGVVTQNFRRHTHLAIPFHTSAPPIKISFLHLCLEVGGTCWCGWFFKNDIVYDNNHAATVLKSFLNGVSAFGLPICVRSDNGGENVDVWRHITTNPSCVITKSSAHNVRV